MPSTLRFCGPRLRGRLALAAALLILAAGPARANDRPFQVARTAVAEDDDNTWSFESWLQRYGSVRGFSVEPEYTFDPHFSIQVELTRLVDHDEAETGHEAEVEFKYVFNNIARDGWGLALSGTVAGERTQASGRTVESLALKVPLSIALGDSGTLLHLNGGLGKARGEQRAWTAAAAIEREIFPRTLLFAEVAREGEQRYGQIGTRYWLKREKLAIDVAVQQQRSDGQRASGFIIGLGWYDL